MSQAMPSPDARQARFEALQARLIPQWKSIESINDDEQTMVVVPSMSLELNVPGSVMQAYEERMLFLLLLLRQPRARIIYVTSQAIHPSIVDYYLGLLPGVIPSHARRRLHLVTPLDGTSRPLTEKLLERPRLLARLRSLIHDPASCHLVPFNTTELERDLALALHIPMYGADPKFFRFGTKSGCRQLFDEEGVSHPIGVHDLHDVGGLVAALKRVRTARPSAVEAMVKLNEGVSGEGNAVVDLRGLPAPGHPSEADAIGERLRRMSFELAGATFDGYLAKLGQRGGIVEERIVGDDFRSPSVQLRITPLGKVELLSTHDQLLGGPTGQTYMGCRFPADAGYAVAITHEAAKVGSRLAREGVIGRFAVDFVTVRRDGRWHPYAIEINLRKGGTTHPYLTLEFLTDGTYQPDAGVFVAPDGRHKCYVATDYLKADAYRHLTPDDLFDVAIRHGLHFNHARQTGVVFHMVSAMSEQGRLGFTAVADTHAAADDLYARAVATLHDEASAASLAPEPDV